MAEESCIHIQEIKDLKLAKEFVCEECMKIGSD